MTKAELISKIEAELRRELDTLTAAAKAAHEAATHEESRAEDPHDTRGLEASYLAGAQAARVSEIQRQLRVFQSIPEQVRTSEAAPGSRISAGSLIELQELQSEGKTSLWLLTPSGGGLSLQAGAHRIQVITPQSALGEALLGARAGEEIEVELAGSSKSYKILTVR